LKKILLTFILLLFLSSVLIAPEAAQAQSAQIPELIIPGPVVESMEIVMDPMVSRSQQVYIDYSVIEFAAEQEQSQIHAQLFFDAEYLIDLTSRDFSEDGGVVLTGKVSGIPESEVYLSLVGDSLYGKISLPDATYIIKPVDQELHMVQQVSLTGLPAQLPSLSPDVLSPISGMATGDDDGGQIDVMVVYTPAARYAAGGTNAIQSLINLVMNEINEGYANSNIVQRINLVNTSEISYDESFYDWNTILNHLTKSDNVIDQVHTWRNTYKADLVVMLIDKGGYCGLGWLMDSNFASGDYDFSPYGFSVVAVDCEPGGYTMSHEMGHNMGAQHDRETAGGSKGAFSYSFGKREDGYYYTIMAYACKNTPCTGINFFSNPAVYYDGWRTGEPVNAADSADNHLTLNNTRVLVANFKDGPGPMAPESLTVTSSTRESIQLGWADTSNNEIGFKVERATPTGNFTEIGVTAANAISFNNTSLTCDTTYLYRVRAYNHNGSSAYSNVITASTKPCLEPPTNLQATATSTTSIKLTWTDASDNENGFRIERALSGSTSWTQIAQVAANTSTYTNTGLTCSSTYQYRVFAYDAIGDSMPSNIASENTVVCAPSSLTLTPMSQKRLRLTWVDNSPNEDGFRVLRWNGSSWTQIGQVGSNVTSFEDYPLSCSTSYQYRVLAFVTARDTDWSSLYQYSSASGSTKTCGVPPQVTGLLAAARSISSIQLSWNDILDDETSYRIERSPNGSSDWTLVGTTQADMITFVNYELTNGTTYYYRVAGVNSYGTGTFSTVSSAATFSSGLFIPIINP